MGFWPVVENVLKNSDIVVLVLDARMPELSRNKEIEKKVLYYGKELVYAYTKADLVNRESLDKLKKQYPDGFFVSGTKNIGIKKLRLHLQILSKKMKLKNPRVGIVGYPNLGKSAIINALARRARAAVADLSGTTRGTQWIKAGNLLILDSPGVIPYEDKNGKLMLLGSKHAQQTSNPEKVACDIISMFIEKNRKALFEKYGIEHKQETDPYDIMLQIGRKRGYLKKGGEVDDTKTAILIIQDWQKGKLIL